jgi:hypothetical protein
MTVTVEVSSQGTVLKEVLFFCSEHILYLSVYLSCSWYRKQWSLFWKAGSSDLSRVDVLYQTDLARVAGMPCDPSSGRLAKLT